MGTGVPSAFSILPQIFTQRQGKAGEENEAKESTEQHKQMERNTMFLDWKNQYYENDCATQSILQSQCYPY